MKKILLLLLISISGYSQTLLKLKAIEYAPGAGYCVITNSLGVQTYTPCSSLSSTVVPTWDATLNVDNLTYASPLISDGTMTFIQGVGNKNVDLRYDYIKLQDSPSTPLFEANLTTNSVTVNGNQVATVNQLPVLTASTGITVSGTSPNYTLSATGTASTTTLTGINNVTVTGTIPNYSVGVVTSPTFTNSTLTGTTTLTGAINFSMSASVASSATVNLAALTGNVAHITGTTSITSLGTVQAGAQRTLIFDGILTLTSNTVSLILPGNTDIVTAANDVAVFVSEGSGNWRMTSYLRNDESYINYTPSFTGFSANPTITAGDCRYKMLSKNTCHVIIWVTTNGTSNSAAMTVTLPFAAASTGGSGQGLQQSVMGMVNNGSQTNGSVRTQASSNILNCYSGIVGSAFTASGAKGVFLNFVYQTTN